MPFAPATRRGCLLDDAAGVHHDEAVQRSDGGETVGDRDHGLTFHQAVEALLDGGFRPRSQARWSLRRAPERRVARHHTGNGDALALATAELDAALADMGLHAAPARLGSDRPSMNSAAWARGGGGQIGVRRVRAAVADVVIPSGAGRGVLRDHADVAAQESCVTVAMSGRRSGCGRCHRPAGCHQARSNRVDERALARTAACPRPIFSPGGCGGPGPQ